MRGLFTLKHAPAGRGGDQTSAARHSAKGWPERSARAGWDVLAAYLIWVRWLKIRGDVRIGREPMPLSMPEDSRPRFLLPPRAAFAGALLDLDYGYALNNYYGWDPIAAARRRRLQIALELALPDAAARARARSACVIDMGCADGVLVPTLCRSYRRVVAVEHNPQLAGYCSALIARLGLANAECVCNERLDLAGLRERIGEPAATMFLLETLEHAGSQPDIWGSKMAFLDDCFTLLEPGGTIVISVPRMVGPIVIAKYLLQRGLGLRHDRISWRQLVQSGIFSRTDELEPHWVNISHVGFNHLKLEQHLAARFRIARRRQSLITLFYAIERRPPADPPRLPFAPS